ncbi:MAG: branched-chain amino acid ABC transporter ATP-binding protein/permease [Ilumatobacter sp.]|uniref:branched-chain amino acid ABC transporter ATP-binding protein/permease n=1 Tax=Ilumatobacter sp. TaxID=1967498 RepID=UPI003C7344A8
MTTNVRRDVAMPVLGSLLTAGLLIGVGLLVTMLIDGRATDKLVTTMFIDAIIVAGIQIYVGNTGVFSFGHIGFGAIAGYVFALYAISPEAKATRIADAPFGLADVNASPLVAVFIAVAVTLVFAIFIGIGLARSGAKSGAVSATVITLALLFVTHEVASSWANLTGGNRSGLTFGIGETLQSRWPIYGALLAALIVARLFGRSRAGRLAVAAREDNLASRSMGVDPIVQQTIALLLSVVIVSVGSSLRVYELGSVLPDLFFFDYTLITLVMLVVGGRNSVTGAMLGVVVITVVREAARRLGSSGYELFGIGLDDAPLDWIFREGLPTVVLGLAMVGFMILRPSGLIGDWELDVWLSRKFSGSTPEPADVAPVAQDRTARLIAQDVTVDFGGFRALDHAALDVGSDEVVGLIGPNGAGKTTLVNVVTGLVPPTSGSVSLDGNDLTNAPAHKIARAGLVRTFQNLRLFSSLTVYENVEVSALVAETHRKDREPVDIDQLIRAAGLWDQRDRRAGELDYGNSRRLELARAAAMLPSFLLLDEPTSGMSDSESLEMVKQVRSMAAAVGAGVVVIDHDLAFINEICDRIYCLDQGKVIAVGTPTEVQAHPQVRAAYLGSSAPT